MNVVRLASGHDAGRIVAMGSRFLAESEYHGRIADNPEQMRVLVDRMVGHADTVCFVATDQQDQAIGFIACFCFIHPISGERMASEIVWWVEPEHRGVGKKLLNHAEQWARDQNVQRFQMIAPNDRIAKLYESLGYVKVETVYQREVA